MGKNTKEISKAKKNAARKGTKNRTAEKNADRNAARREVEKDAPKKNGTPVGGKLRKVPEGGHPVVKVPPKQQEVPIPVETRINSATEGHMAGRFASVKIFGHSLTSVLAAAKKAGMMPAEMRKALNAIGLAAVADSQIADKMSSRYAAKCENGKGTIAPLGKAEIARLRKAAEAGSAGEDIE